jgi:hypothetical protein
MSVLFQSPIRKRRNSYIQASLMTPKPKRMKFEEEQKEKLQRTSGLFSMSISL